MNGVLARNVEFSQLIVDYQRKLREVSESLHSADEHSRKLTIEVKLYTGLLSRDCNHSHLVLLYFKGVYPKV